MLLMDDNASSLIWKFGRVIKTYPGRDSVLRVVNMRNSNDMFKRAVPKECILPIDFSTATFA